MINNKRKNFTIIGCMLVVAIVSMMNIMNVGASIPVTYSCCNNFSYSDGIQLDNFEDIWLQGFQLDNFENLSNWTVGGTGASQQVDNINFREGTQGLKLIAANGNRAYTDKAININFSNISSFGIWVYIPDISNFNYIQILFTSSGTQWSKDFTFYKGSLKSGWNKIVFDKSSFVPHGGENWNNTMNRVRFSVTPVSGKNINVTVDDFRYAKDYDWIVGGSGGNIQNDNINVKEGEQGKKLIATTSDSYMDKTINNNFSDNNNFVIWTYIEDSSKLYSIRLYISSYNGPTWERFFYDSVYVGVRSGWNKLIFNKHDFINNGNESWNNVMVRMRLRITPTSNNSANVTFDDLRYNMTGQRAKLMIEFDDAEPNVLLNAFPILSRNNQTATTFVITGWAGSSAPADWNSMNLTQLKVLQDAGWDISSHTVNHGDPERGDSCEGIYNCGLTYYDDSELISELNDSYAWLYNNNFKKSAGFIAYPFGKFNDNVLDKVKKRYIFGRSTQAESAQPHLTTSDDAFMYIQRVTSIHNDTSVSSIKDKINDTINSKLLGQLLFHKVINDTTDTYAILPANFQEISDYIKSRSSDIDVVTYSDYVIPNINNFTPVINKTTRIFSNGSSILITKNKYDELMSNMTVKPSSNSIDINITQYNETGGIVKFNESSENSSLSVFYYIGDRIPYQWYNVKIYWANGTKYQEFSVLANNTGYINYSSQGFGDSRYQEIDKTNALSNNIPPSPTNINSSAGNFWVNTTWMAGAAGNKTDSYNVIVNGTWSNGTTSTYYNNTIGPHGWSNITVWAYNSSGTGSLSVGNVIQRTQIPDNPPLQSTIGNKVVDERQWLNFTVKATDADNDTITYGTNATKGNFNAATGDFTWLPTYSDSDAGVYVWYFNSSDGYGGVVSETITVTVNNVPLSVTSSLPESDPITTIGTAQTFNISLNRTANVTWYINGSETKTDPGVISASYTNSNAGIGIHNITAIASDGYDTVLRSWNWTVLAQPAYNVSGYVFDNYGTGLGDVLVQNGSIQNTTSASGYYFITGLNGTYNFNFSKPGFNTDYLDVTINGTDNSGVNKTIYDTTPPDTVTGLTNDTPTRTNVNLTWNLVAGADQYQVFRNSTSLGYTLNRYWNDTGLVAGTLYQYQVRANDSYNNWGQNSSILSIETAQAADAIPPGSVSSPAASAGNFYINNTWVNPQDADLNHTMFRYSNGSLLQNVSTPINYLNLTWQPHYTQNISAQTVDISGNINQTLVWFNATIPDNAPVQSTIGSKVVDERQWLNFTVKATDADNDTITYGTNATKGNFNAATGDFTWLPAYSDAGVYVWSFNSNDGYGSVVNETITVTVNNVPLSVTSSLPASDPTTTAGTAQTFNISLNRTANVTWYINGSETKTDPGVISASYANSNAGIGIHNITVIASDGYDTVLISWNWTVLAQPAYNVSGYVFDNYGTGLGDVLVQNGSIQNTTSASGYYSIQGLLNGTYNFSFSKPGFNTGYLDVTINGTDNSGVNKTIYNTTSSIQIDGFENLTNWKIGGTGASQQVDTINFKEGTQGLKLIATNGNRAYTDKTINNKFSTTNNFSIWVYVYNSTTLNGFTLYFTSTGTAWSKYYYKTTYGLVNGWNRIIIPQGNFLNFGGENWNNTMNRVRIAVWPFSGKNTNVTIDDLIGCTEYCNVMVQPTYNVSGYVFDNYGTGLGNVLVQNGSIQNTTLVSGYYSIHGLLNGTYNFSFSKPGFNTGYLDVTINGADINANKTIYNTTSPIQTYNVSGYVFDNYGTGLGDVLVQNGSIQNTTLISGYYSIYGLLNGTYNFSFSKPGFNTGYLDVTINGADNTSANKTIYNTTSPIQLDGFENLTNWKIGGTGASQQVDTINFKEGTQGLKLIATNGNRAYTDKTINNKFSTTNNFSVWVYVYNSTTLNGVTLYFTSTGTTWSKYYYKSTYGLVNGWNRVITPQGDFLNFGGEDWNNTMNRVRIAVWPYSGKNTNVTIDDLRYTQQL